MSNTTLGLPPQVAEYLRSTGVRDLPVRSPTPGALTTTPRRCAH